MWHLPLNAKSPLIQMQRRHSHTVSDYLMQQIFSRFWNTDYRWVWNTHFGTQITIVTCMPQYFLGERKNFYVRQAARMAAAHSKHGLYLHFLIWNFMILRWMKHTEKL